MTGGFCGNEVQLDRCIRRVRREIERAIGIHSQIPRINPGEPFAVIETCIAEAAAAHFLVKEKPLSRRVSDREMRELQIIHDEARSRSSSLGGRTNSLAEKSQLIAETSPAIVRQVAGEIPPLGFEFRVRMMIAREIILPSRLGDLPIRRHAANRQDGNPIGRSKSEICESASFAPHRLRDIDSSRPPRWNPSGHDRRRDDPDRRPGQRPPREGELNRPSEKSAIDHAGQDKGQAKARSQPKHAGEQTDHPAFPEEQTPDLCRRRPDRAHHAQFPRAFRHQRR